MVILSLRLFFLELFIVEMFTNIHIFREQYNESLIVHHPSSIIINLWPIFSLIYSPNASLPYKYLKTNSVQFLESFLDQNGNHFYCICFLFSLSGPFLTIPIHMLYFVLLTVPMF